MRITTRGMEVRIFPEDQPERDSVDLVAMSIRRGIHVCGSEKFLFFVMPQDRELLYEALKIIVGRRQSERLCASVRQELR